MYYFPIDDDVLRKEIRCKNREIVDGNEKFSNVTDTHVRCITIRSQ
jgi:hypothetical protein